MLAVVLAVLLLAPWDAARAAAPPHDAPAASPLPGPTVAGAATPPAGDVLAAIHRRGELVAGVKLDYPPFGFLDHDQRPLGFEHELAAEVARRLGVRLRTVGVNTGNRLQKLRDGDVDLLIATTGDTADRRRLVTMVEPAYYASGVSLFVPPGRHWTAWTELRGQPVCAVQGAYFNRAMAHRFGLELRLYGNARDARLAVRSGQCVGWMFDHTAMLADLARPEWAGYSAALPPVMETPWAIAVAPGRTGDALARWLGDTVADWHRSGWLRERERAWGIPPAAFLAQAQATWSARGDDGAWRCRRQPDGQWPAACRDTAFVGWSEAGGAMRLGLWLRDRLGVDASVLYDAEDRRVALRGVALTLLLTLLCLPGSLGFGIGAALLASARWRPGAAAVRAGVAVVRMTPPLLNIYLLLFGVGAALGWSLAPLPVVVACLSAYTGGAVAAALLDATAARQRATPGFRLRPHTLAAVWPLASNGITAALINVSKATMMAAAFGVPELMSAAQAIIGERGNIGVVMNALLACFVAVVAGVTWGLRWGERRLLHWLATRPADGPAADPLATAGGDGRR